MAAPPPKLQMRRSSPSPGSFGFTPFSWAMRTGIRSSGWRQSRTWEPFPSKPIYWRGFCFLQERIQKEKIEIENMRKSLVQSLQAYTQAIPQMAMQGGDPSMIIKKIADVIKSRQKGVTIEDAVEEVFAPEELPPAGPAELMVEQTSPAPAGAPVGGASPEGAPPSLQTLLSNLTLGGKASASARTSTRR